MAKTRNKKQNFANKSKKDSEKKVNPFDIHVNRQKFKVIGQKSKHDRGLPGVSRAKAINKRKNTLLQEYKLRNKTNQFLDRRIGEKNGKMTAEDKIMARYTAERVKTHKRKSIFNLGDDDILTHRGTTLSEIEKFDDPRSDDEFSDDGNSKGGQLNANFVGDAHFGGGVLTDTGKEGAKSRKDLIDELIAESKRRKAEKQKAKEQTLELTEKLDNEWKDLIPLLTGNQKTESAAPPKQPVDSFDKVMRELKFEARGQPSDRLKSEDEIAKEEKERLEKLEADRIQRMKGFINGQQSKPVHKSADDLDDNFVYSDLENDDEEPDAENADKQNENDTESEEESDDDDDDDDDSDSLSDLKEDESESENESGEEKAKDGGDNESESFETNKINSSDSESEEPGSKMELEIEKVNKSPKDGDKKRKLDVSDSNDSKKPKLDMSDSNDNKKPKLDMSDSNDSKKPKLDKSDSNDSKKPKLDMSDSNDSKKPELDSNNLPKTDIVKDNSVCGKEIVLEKISDETETKEEKGIENKIEADLMARKAIMDKARSELPYTFAMPETYEELQKLLDDHSRDEINIIIERIIKCNHPGLSEGNKDKLSTLFKYLLQYLNDVSTDLKSDTEILNCFLTLDRLAPHLFDLAQLIPANAYKSVLEVLKEKKSDYIQERKYKNYPDFDTLIFLKLISLLFPTSDFRHQVVTPALVFMNQLLTKCRVKNRRDISIGLLLSTLILEYTFLSKRFVPAVLNFLSGILHMSVPKAPIQTLRIVPPFKSTGKCSVLLALNEKCDEAFDVNASKMLRKDFVEDEIDNDFKLRTMFNVCKLTLEFYSNLNELPSSNELFEPILDMLERLPLDYYPNSLQTEINNTLKTLRDGKENKRIDYVVMEKQRPKALKLYEPDIQKVYDSKQHKSTSKEKAERAKLVHKFKREMKGAIREIRRDNTFISKLKIKEQIQSGIEAREKQKKIFSEASIQQGELNSLSRKKKK